MLFECYPKSQAPVDPQTIIGPTSAGQSCGCLYVSSLLGAAVRQKLHRPVWEIGNRTPDLRLVERATYTSHTVPLSYSGSNTVIDLTSKAGLNENKIIRQWELDFFPITY